MKTQTPVDPDEARAAARHIVSGRQYRASPTPRPFRGPLDWLGDRLHGIADWFGRVLSHVPTFLLLVIALGIVIAAVVYVVAKARARGGAPLARRGSDSRADEQSEDPGELERRADAAEHDGDLDRALRLRFRAGLLRLGDRGAIRYRPSLTTTEVRRALGSESFDDLARVFEAVAYGGRDAAPPDVEAARRTWPQVVANASRKTGD